MKTDMELGLSYTKYGCVYGLFFVLVKISVFVIAAYVVVQLLGG